MKKLHRVFRGIIYLGAFYIFFRVYAYFDTTNFKFSFLFGTAVVLSILMDIFRITYEKINIELSDAFTAFFYLVFGLATAVYYEAALIFVITLANHFFYRRSSQKLDRLLFNVSMFVVATFGAAKIAENFTPYFSENIFLNLSLKALFFVTGYLLLNLLLYSIDRSLENNKLYVLSLEAFNVLLLNGLVSVILSVTMTEIFTYVNQIGAFLIFGILYLIHHALYLYFRHKRTNQNIKILLKITEEIVKYGDFEKKCQSLIRDLQKIIPYQVATLYTFDIECNDVVYPVAYHAPEGFDIGELYLNLRKDSKSHQILAAGRPYISKNTKVDKKIKITGKLGEVVEVSIFLPLKVEGEVLGAIIIGGGEELNEVIADGNIDLLNILANQLALALNNFLYFKDTEDRAKKDSLTGLYNRWVFREEVQKLVAEKVNFSLIIIDLDDFKKVNDTYGHLTGDIVLKEIGEIVRTSVRETDLACRYGGEEFVIIFKELNKHDAFIISERIRKRIEAKRFISGENVFKVTISGGIASYPGDGDSIEEVFKKADDLLYDKCKKAGKNKVIIWEMVS